MMALSMFCWMLLFEPSSTEEVVYSFEDSLEGWGAATETEMAVELAGTFRGAVTGGNAHIDSPAMALSAEGRQSVVMRMKYQGGAGRGASWKAWYATSTLVRDHSEANWAVRTPEVNVSALSDGDLETFWIATSELFVDDDIESLELLAGPTGVRDGRTGGAPRSLEVHTKDGVQTWTLQNTTEPFHIPLTETPVRLIFNGSYWGTDPRISEIRLGPSVVESSFGIAADPDFQTYVVPIWKHRPTNPLKLTHLRLSLGKLLPEPWDLRNFDVQTSEACLEWTSPQDPVPSWASTRWRLIVNDARTMPWIVSEFHPYADAGCSHSLATAVSTPSSGVLVDGQCPDDTMDPSETSFWRGWDALELEFQTEVAIRCVILCQSSNEAGRAATATLQRWVGSWTDHATLDLPAQGNVVVANPCDLRYVPVEEQRARDIAYDGSNAGFYDEKPPSVGEGFAIEWIRIVKPPIVRRVTGCVDIFWPLESPRIDEPPVLQREDAVTDRDDAFVLENGVLRRGIVTTLGNNATYATTMNCPLAGGSKLELRGDRLKNVNVFVDERPCLDVVEDSDSVTCTLPEGTGGVVDVVVRRKDIPELYDRVAYLKYQGPPEKTMDAPGVSNVGARSVDLSWTPPDLWSALVTTGYVVTFDNKTIHLGNVTTTTVIDLEPGTTYQFAIAAVSEPFAEDTVDKYGRRALREGAQTGQRSPWTPRITTKLSDVNFLTFTANATRWFDPSENATMGPTGVFGGEDGHFGLELVGAANVENCNLTHTCCDGYLHGCPEETVICSETRDASDKTIPKNNPMGDFAVEKRFLVNNSGLATAPCGPALRLTSAGPRQSGAFWYGRDLEVGEGFDTRFRFELSQPSQRCDRAHGAYTHCVSRGADGLAFVIQRDRHDLVGTEGAGIGYDGISNGIAVEFDTYYNPELDEPYQNHIAVHATLDPRKALASTTAIPDLTDDVINARIVYDPIFDPSFLDTPYFLTSPHLASLGTDRLGTLQVYIHDVPVLVTPLDLDSLLDLAAGRAFVGFTASTGLATYQVHDLLDWSFTSLRKDII